MSVSLILLPCLPSSLIIYRQDLGQNPSHAASAQEVCNNTTSEDEARDESILSFEERATELSEMQADIDRLLDLDIVKQRVSSIIHTEDERCTGSLTGCN